MCGLTRDTRDDGVGLQGVLVPPDRLAPAIGADVHRGHVGLDRHAQGLLADAVLGEQIALALGGGAAVAAHRGDDERLAPRSRRMSSGGPDDGRRLAMPRLPTPTATDMPGLIGARQCRLPKAVNLTATSGRWPVADGFGGGERCAGCPSVCLTAGPLSAF